MVKAINKMHDKLSKPAEPEPEKEPEPTKEELLLAEIRDLLKEQEQMKSAALSGSFRVGAGRETRRDA